MTDPIDDALDTNTPTFDTPRLDVEWREMPPGYGAWARGVNAPDNLSDLGQQLGPDGFSTSQSLIDGLPDAVTMTSGNDGFGTLDADLVSRNSNQATTWNQKTARQGSGSAAVLLVPAPTDSSFGDYQLAAVGIDSASALTLNVDPYDQHAWRILGSVADGAMTVWVFGRRWYTGAPDLDLTLPGTVNYAWVTQSFWASAALVGTIIDMVPGGVVTLAEAVSGTAHTLPVQTLGGRGWTFGFWLTTTAAGPWTAPAPDVEVIEATGAVLDLTMTRSATQQSPYRSAMVANTNSATSAVAAVGVSLMFRERPSLSTSGYFSPYSTDSPLYGFARDNADLTAYQTIVTPIDGIKSTTVFTGQMLDIAVKSSSNTADLSAVSKTRTLMDRARTPPPIWGRLEGLDMDWFANWLMANGGQTVGPGPTTKTRFWVPYYGSSKAFSWQPQDWSPVDLYTSDAPSVIQRHIYPEGIEGPYVGGMFGCYTNDIVYQVQIDRDRINRFAPIPGIDSPEQNDFMSQANSEGRMTCWFRADPFLTGVTKADAFTDTTFQLLLRFTLASRSNLLTLGSDMGGVRMVVNPTTGTGGARIDPSMGNQAGYTVGTTTFTWPTDGEWHFICFAWNFATGQMKIQLDGDILTYSSVATAGPANVPALPVTEQQLYQSGGFNILAFRGQLPVADVQVESGPGMYAEGGARFWPKPDPQAIFRRTGVKMTALYESLPIAGWDTLLELAKATTSAVRCNEDDNIEFLPQSYFAEAEQIDVEWIADSETNASAMDVKQDPSKSRNSVTINFSDTSVDANASSILDVKSTVEVLPGVTYYTFALDRPCVELHGANNPSTGSLFDIVAATAAQIATPSTLPTSQPYMTVNTKADGSGTVPSATTVKGRIMWCPDATSVVVRLTNYSRIKYYLTNSGAEVSFLKLLGYGVKASPAYATVRDDMSVRLRNERTLSHDNEWIQQRAEAVTLAANIANVISYPRGEINVTVMGDPRRKPGRLVQIVDSEGTQAEGVWRVLSITHKSAGAQYVQGLQLVRVGSTMIWDGSPGWDQGVWGE